MLPTFLLVPWLCPTREYFNIIQRFQLGKIPLSEKVKDNMKILPLHRLRQRYMNIHSVF